jgi:DNA-binding NtrC family response regulator
MGPHRIRCALVLIDDDDRSVQLLARLARQDSYAVAMTVGSATAARHRNARMLVRLLRLDGYLVDSSIGNWTALENLSRRPHPNALIVDADAQLESASALIRHVRVLAPGLPAVLLTDRPDEMRDAVAGLVPEPLVLEKPIDYAELRMSILSAVHHRTTSEIVSIRGDGTFRAAQMGRNRR